MRRSGRCRGSPAARCPGSRGALPRPSRRSRFGMTPPQARESARRLESGCRVRGESSELGPCACARSGRNEYHDVRAGEGLASALEPHARRGPTRSVPRRPWRSASVAGRHWASRPGKSQSRRRVPHAVSRFATTPATPATAPSRARPSTETKRQRRCASDGRQGPSTSQSSRCASSATAMRAAQTGSRHGPPSHAVSGDLRFGRGTRGRDRAPSTTKLKGPGDPTRLRSPRSSPWRSGLSCRRRRRGGRATSGRRAASSADRGAQHSHGQGSPRGLEPPGSRARSKASSDTRLDDVWRPRGREPWALLEDASAEPAGVRCSEAMIGRS